MLGLQVRHIQGNSPVGKPTPHRFSPYLLPRCIAPERPVFHYFPTSDLQTPFCPVFPRQHTRPLKIIRWRLSNTLDAHFCVEVLARGARALWPSEMIFNSDQGSQFTSVDFSRRAQGGWHSYFDGRQGPLDGQRLHASETVAFAQVRVRLAWHEFATGAQARTG